MPEYVLNLGGADEAFNKLDEFTRGYVEAAFWTGDEETGVPDKTFADLTPEALQQMIDDCANFQESERALLDRAGVDLYHRHGVDFWLTRNGHGAGFWDRGYPCDLRRGLTDAAHLYGSADLYVGDDGKVYHA